MGQREERRNKYKLMNIFWYFYVSLDANYRYVKKAVFAKRPNKTINGYFIRNKPADLVWPSDN